MSDSLLNSFVVLKDILKKVLYHEKISILNYLNIDELSVYNKEVSKNEAAMEPEELLESFKVVNYVLNKLLVHEKLNILHFLTIDDLTRYAKEIRSVEAYIKSLDKPEMPVKPDKEEKQETIKPMDKNVLRSI